MVMAQRKLQYDEQEHYQNEQMRKPYTNRKKSPSKKAHQAQKYGIQNMVLVLFVIAIFGLIGAKTVYTTVVKGAEVRGLEKQIQNLSIESDLLQVQLNKLQSVDRIEKQALAMGMEKPEGTIYIASNLIESEKTAGVEQTQKTAALPVESKTNSVFNNVLMVFTSFFGSTQS